MTLSCQELTTLVQGELQGDPLRCIQGPAKIEEAGPDEVTFLANPKYLPFVEACRAGLLLVEKSQELPQLHHTSVLRVSDPYRAFGLILHAFEQQRLYPAEIHPQSWVDPQAHLGEGVGVGAFATVGRGAVVGSGTRIAAHVYVGARVQIGKDCILHPGVRLMDDCEIGDRCILYANAVVGSDGFGYAPNSSMVYTKIPQVGRVILGNDVEIGAHATIDRATMGATVVGHGSKIDNLVHLAHNVEIGEHTVIAAQTGISGSTKVGNRCVFGGQVGVAGHITIADGSQVGGQTGITRSINEPNRKWNGTPLMPYLDNQRSNAVFRRLPDLEADLRNQIKSLQEALDQIKSADQPPS
ncbi:MAG: UDP-3-O-(3-hydroxymyristoyl)glucosamine N-acyltransferase [Bacteroidota bacterium]